MIAGLRNAQTHEQMRTLEQIHEQGRVRNRITRFRKRSGEAIDTFHSAGQHFAYYSGVTGPSLGPAFEVTP